ncbi:hypothetical protein MMC15_000446 [Xylographa vitiligo]|nr:hypothetical protein [Xylographa vitiligo]
MTRMLLEVAIYLRSVNELTEFATGYLAELRSSCLMRGLLNDQGVPGYPIWCELGRCDLQRLQLHVLLRMQSAIDYRICRPEFFQMPSTIDEQALLKCRPQATLRELVRSLDTRATMTSSQALNFDETTNFSPESTERRSGLELAAGLSFDPKALSLHAIRQLGGLQIKWTLKWQEHLFLDVSGGILYLYQLPSFTTNGALFHNSLEAHEDLRLSMKSYSLLFSSYDMNENDYRAFREHEKVKLNESLESPGLSYQACRFHFDTMESSATAFFKSFYCLPLPWSWGRYPNLNRKKKTFKWMYDHKMEVPTSADPKALTVMRK